MLPKATSSPPDRAAELRLLTEQPLFIEIQGFLEEDRKGVFPEALREESQALRAFDLMKSNAALFQLGSAALRVLAGLHLSETADGEGGGPRRHLPDHTALFHTLPLQPLPLPLPPPTRRPQAGPQAPLQLCLLAAEACGRSSVFDGEDLRRLGVHPSALSFPGREYSPEERRRRGLLLVHPSPSVQQFLAAMFYVLGRKSRRREGLGGCWWQARGCGETAVPGGN